MKNKLLILTILLFLLPSSFSQVSEATSIPGKIYEGDILLGYRNVTVYAPAVASTDEGYVGVISTITLTVQNNGDGRVFVDTLPLTEIDMQGSARLAVKVAGALVERDNISISDYDFFFVVRTSAQVIGGPSAGAVMTLATIAVLENWTIDSNTVMTGMINPDGSIGPVGGIPEKIDAAYSVGAARFLIPKGQGTYTETITETTVSNGITQIIPRSVTRSVADYAMENYGIEVQEIADINEALNYSTGYYFPLPESEQKITTEDYIDSMKPLATTLLQEARQAHENASNALETVNIPNNFPTYYRSQVLEQFNNGEISLEESEYWYNRSLYYTSTSKSFQALIYFRCTSYACEYFASDDDTSYIESLIEEAESLYDEKSKEAKNAEINGVISLQCVGAAQKRAGEADYYINDAENEYYGGSSFFGFDVVDFLYKLAFAYERSQSVGWWIGIGSHFNDTGEINNTILINLVGEYIGEAQEATHYSRLILEEIGGSVTYLNEADNLLDDAGEDVEKGYPAAALFEALEALVKANLALEMINAVPEEKIDRARESASSSIGESRNLGMEPVLAVSYYEYAQSLVNESSFESALVYYKYSDIIAGALSFTSSFEDESSRYVGIPAVSTPSQGWWFLSSLYYSMIFFILGGTGGLGLGLIIGSIVFRRQKKKYDQQWIPRSIYDYYRKH